MPSSATGKTKSAPKKLRGWHRPAFTLFVGLLILAAVLVGVHTPRSSTTLRVRGHEYHLEVASTPAARAKGLSDRATMPENRGMLFAFDDVAVRCFWMKDMRFSLDMLWVRADDRIGAIETNVSPASYPHSFCPNIAARYVIELRAGQTAAAGLRVGQRLDFLQ